jgi:DNA-binding CsgD family transcriptional regulator
VLEAANERFAGRRAELREISARAVVSASGRQQIVVIEGRPGIGKTALVRRALALLPAFQRLYADCARGPAAEQLTGEAGQILGNGSGIVSSELAVALDALLRRGRPVVVALDNLQCIDDASAAEFTEALLVMRAAALLVIVMAREPWSPASGEPEEIDLLREQLLANSTSHIRLTELTVSETGQLLDWSGAGGSDRAAARLHGYTGGHPALLSLMLDHGLTAADARPGDLLGLFDPLVLSILRTVSALPAPSRDLLAAMAVSEERWPLAIVGSVARVDDPFEALEPVLKSGLAEWYPDDTVAPVAIRYPLYRDVIYRSLPLARREVLHTRAASFALGTRAWAHRVAAATAEEPTLPAMLEQEARRYFQAGDSERAGTLLMWSAAATPDPAERQRHLDLAAHWWLTLRAIDWGPRLQACLSKLPPSAPRSLILGILAEAAGHYRQAHALLTEAEQLASVKGAVPALWSDIQLGLALVHADLGNAQEEYRLAASLLAVDGLPVIHRSWAEYHAADAWARMHGAKAALGKLATFVPDSALDGLRDSGPPATSSNERAGSQIVRLWTRGSWRVLAGLLRDGSDDLARMLRAGDRAAIEPVAPVAQAYRGYTHFLLGDWRTAEHAVTQAIAALNGHAVARSQVPVHAIAACVDAASGRSDSALRHVQAAQRWHAECGTADYVAFPAIAAATVAQCRGDYGWMVAALQPLLTDQAAAVMYQVWWLPLAVEALIGTRQLVAAARALRQLTELSGSGRTTATLAWLDAWLAAAGHDEYTARARFEDGLARPPARDDIPLHRARLEHEFGRHLMSRRSRRAAIERLRRAYELYRALGARPFADRCADDLAACGAQLSAPAGAGQRTGADPVLSPQERRIAYLAAQGLTNQEIAGEVFVSAKTVEYHLGNLFAKLGISSRRQLPTRLSGESGE